MVFKYLSCVEIKDTAITYFNTQRILKNHQSKATGEFVFKGRNKLGEIIVFKGRNIRKYMGNC